MKRTPMRAAALALGTALILSGCSASEADSIVMVGVPVDESQNVAESYQIMMDMISEATGDSVEFYESQDYATGTQALISGRVDVAVLSVLSYVLATAASDDVKLLATVARDGGDLPGAYAYGIKSSGDETIRNLSDLRGKTVCYSDPSSGVGYFWPAYSIYKEGIDPDPLESADLKSIFAGTFPLVAVGVANGDCDAGFLLDAMFDTVLPRSEIVDMASLEKFWTSPVLPGLALVYNSSTLSSSKAEAIKQKMLDEGNKSSLVASGKCSEESDCRFLSAAAWGFVASSDDFYEPLRDLCVALDLEECKP